MASIFKPRKGEPSVNDHSTYESFMKAERKFRASQVKKDGEYLRKRI
jgi:hypothetical protein